LSLGDAGLDDALGGGLALGRWHEAAGEGLEAETGVSAGAFVAALAAPLAARGAVVWVMRRDDLYPPGLVGLGFPAERLIQVRVRDEAQTLAVLEEALRSPGVAAAIGEAAAVDLTAGRRLQLACEARGATGFILGRRPFGGSWLAPVHGSAAATRWLIAPAPSALAPSALAPSVSASSLSGLGPPRWKATLERARGGRPSIWLLELRHGFSPSAEAPLRVVAELGDRHLASTPSWRAAG
jgi:protein ImuA